MLAQRPARSSTTQHVLAPLLRRYGRSGARGASIYLERELNAATLVLCDVILSDVSADDYCWAVLDATSGGDVAAGKVVE